MVGLGRGLAAAGFSTFVISITLWHHARRTHVGDRELGKIKGLDGLRGIAVLFVIISHTVLWPYLGIESQKIMALMNGHIGVSIFFVLSGFLITLLLMRERDATGTVDIVAFIKRRSLRIFPVYYLAIFFLMYMDATGKTNIPNCAYPYALTYTVNFIDKGCTHQTISHFWSLSVEEHFYIFWPFIFLLGRRFSLIIAATIAMACVLVGTSLYSEVVNRYPNRWTFPAMLPILVGCITAILHKAPAVKNLFTDSAKSNVMLVAILAGLASPAFANSEVIWLAAMSLLMLYIYYRQDSAVVRILEFKPLALIGLISYGLYVWQGVFTGNGPYRSGSVFPPEMYTGLWLTFIIAPLSYVFFERPIMGFKKRFSWQNKTAAKAA